MIYVLKGPAPEMLDRRMEGKKYGSITEPKGLNTREEAAYLALRVPSGSLVRVVTSAYHVPRAYLTLCAAFREAKKDVLLQVWGTGTVNDIQAKSEAAKLAAYQAKGHALRWEDVT